MGDGVGGIVIAGPGVLPRLPMEGAGEGNSVGEDVGAAVIIAGPGVLPRRPEGAGDGGTGSVGDNVGGRVGPGVRPRRLNPVGF